MKHLAFWGLFICCSAILCAQAVEQPLTKKELHSIYEKGDAEKLYSETLRLYEENAGDDDYNFYLGWALLRLNRNLLVATDHLKYAASKSYHNEIVHLYLGIAYYKTYQFDIARISFNNYGLLAKKKDQKANHLQEWKSRVDKLSKALTSAPTFMLNGLEEIAPDDACTAIPSMACGIRLLNIDALPAEISAHAPILINRADEFHNIPKAFCFSRPNSENGYDVFKFAQSGLTPAKNNNVEILKINTSADEMNPFYSSSEGYLYFSSNRPGGYGGYDIYRVKFEVDNNTIGVPERLPFPINTPFDELLYFPDTCGRMVLLSNRNQAQGKVALYYLTAKDTVISLAQKDWDALHEATLFGPLINIKVVASQKADEESISDLAPVTSTPYDSLIGLAMDDQLIIDSLQSEIRHCRAQLQIDSLSDTKVQEFRSQIYRNQKLINQFRGRIIHRHNQAALLQPEFTKSTMSSTDSALLVVDRVQDGITVYKYTSTFTPDEKVQKEGAVNTTEIDAGESKPIVAEDLPLREFSVGKSSVYKANVEIEINPTLPKQFHYRLQLGAYSQPKTPEDFQWFFPIIGERETGSNITKYYAGEFATSMEAKQAQQVVKEMGFNDAFLVPFYKGRRIGIEQARELEFGNL